MKMKSKSGDAQSNEIRVILAEDHKIVRQGLRSLLDGHGDIRVEGEAADGAEAVELACRLVPDVVIMDLAMPELDGVQAAAAVRESCPKTKVLVLSMHSSEEHVLPAVRAGADGYLLKGSGLSDLVAAIRAIHRGNAFFSPEVSGLLARTARSERGERAGAERLRLTAREREVLELVARGHTSPQIATLLGISAKTVENHRGRIMAKLDIHDLAGLVRYAVRTGLVSAEE
jgi:DNA-binding NarL/FixJ family response regulator